MRDDGHTHGGGAIWRHDRVDDKPGKVNELICMLASTSGEVMMNRFVLFYRVEEDVFFFFLKWGVPRPLHQSDARVMLLTGSSNGQTCRLSSTIESVAYIKYWY